jgi:hypothetical protein
MTGLPVGPHWPWPVACRRARMVVPVFPVLPNSGKGATGWRPIARGPLRAQRAHPCAVGIIGARDLIIDSTPILAWRRAGPDAAFGHAPAQHPRPLLPLPYDDVAVPASS